MCNEKLVIKFDMDLYCILFRSLRLKLLGFSDRFLVCEDLMTGLEYLISRCRFEEIQVRNKDWYVCIESKEYYKQKLQEYNEYRSTLPIYHDLVYFIICIIDITYNVIIFPKTVVRRLFRIDKG